jgi:RNA polymerase sigma-70 factor (ECF subfamily)
MTSAAPDTDDLVRLAGEGDATAMGELFERHRARLAKMVEVRMDPRLRGRLDPSDVIQESLAAASQRIGHYAHERPLPFYPWLRQIAWEKLVHLHDRHLRAMKRSVAREQFLQPEISDESIVQLAECFVGSATSPSGVAVRKEIRERVRLALNTLSEEDREVLLLRYLEQLPSQEIAHLMGTSEAAVNMRHMRALERMRKRLHTPGKEI